MGGGGQEAAGSLIVETKPDMVRRRALQSRVVPGQGASPLARNVQHLIGGTISVGLQRGPLSAYYSIMERIIIQFVSVLCCCLRDILPSSPWPSDPVQCSRRANRPLGMGAAEPVAPAELDDVLDNGTNDSVCVAFAVPEVPP